MNEPRLPYFVTGGSGLIGACVTRSLARAGHPVTVYDLAPDIAFLDELIEDRDARARVSVVAGDVTDLPQLLRTMQESGARRVIHLAALLGKKSDENPLRALKVNVESVINVFEAALSLGIERVVWASSVGVFGSRHRVGETVALPNDAPHKPSTFYGATKSFAERVALHYRRTRGLNAVGLRFVLVYGYGKDRTIARGTGADFTAELIDKPALGMPGRVPAGGAFIDFLDIEDAARAVILAAEAPPGRSVALNITGYRASLREAATIAQRLMPEADITIEEGDWNGTDHHYDGAIALAEIGYAPTITIEEGFRRNIEEVRRRAAAIRRP